MLSSPFYFQNSFFWARLYSGDASLVCVVLELYWVNSGLMGFGVTHGGHSRVSYCWSCTLSLLPCTSGKPPEWYLHSYKNWYYGTCLHSYKVLIAGGDCEWSFGALYEHYHETHHCRQDRKHSLGYLLALPARVVLVLRADALFGALWPWLCIEATDISFAIMLVLFLRGLSYCLLWGCFILCDISALMLLQQGANEMVIMVIIGCWLAWKTFVHGIR